MRRLARVVATMLFAGTLTLIPAQSAGAVEPAAVIAPGQLCFTCWLPT